MAQRENTCDAAGPMYTNWRCTQPARHHGPHQFGDYLWEKTGDVWARSPGPWVTADDIQEALENPGTDGEIDFSELTVKQPSVQPDRVSIRISVTPLTAKWLVAAAKASSAIDDDTNVPMAKLVERLTNHAADGARRPGAWERGWLNQVLGLDGDPVELVDCEHDWDQDGRPLRQCSKCFGYDYGEK